ncbi:major acid phosphatase map (histidine-acid phosphatase) [Stylonychia lemnae]|uniref:Major acid phosphatase map (Histidine-acid phosphatase) n=1 Tax=Stylonychia lemnae TaxID=5949 RepID=A0A077ZSA6_STYLE|nr:major acid phosphatase map (histidine-acid phosphatase) [Stylonychia lemnae]|eukprot:CDW72250.1 major acid phosphatase map (histidine-acid phosphatase) [Stylonychia lemnae]
MKIDHLILLVSSLSMLTQAADKLGFVFELVRHGARAPQKAQKDQFMVPEGMLTASGQRQRYLMGSLNKQRYIDIGLLDDTYNPAQIYIQSTNFFRTIQSSYAELIGIYPPSQKTKLNDGEKQSLKSGKGMPKLKIRNQGKTVDPGQDPMEGFQYIPVFNYQTPDESDDLMTGGCKLIDEADAYLFPRNDTYEPVADYIMPVLRKPIQVAYGLTDDQAWGLSYPQLYDYSDSQLAEDKEGIPRRYSYSAEEWFYMRNTQKWALSLTFPQEYKKIFATKIMRNPLMNMHNRMNEINDGDKTRDSLRYFIYSAHDLQIANILEWLHPVGHDFVDVTYGSSIFFELWYDTDCVNSLRDESCFKVKIIHNGMPLKLSTCLDANWYTRGSYDQICTYTDFRAHTTNFGYSGMPLHEKCAETFTPPSME